MGFDVKAYLLDMGFSEKEATEMVPKFGEEVVKKLETQTATQATAKAKFDTDQEALTTAQAALKTSNDRLNADMAEWATLTNAEKAADTGRREALEKSQADTLRLTQTVERIATDHGLDVKKLLEDVTPPVEKPKPTTTEIDTSKFVGTEQLGQIARFLIDLPADLAYIAQAHKDLTGETLDTRTIVAEVKKRSAQKDADVSPVAIWEELHGIPDKREAKQKTDMDTALAAAEERGAERVRSEAALPPTSSPGRHAPIFGVKGPDGVVATRTSALQRPQPEVGVRSAAAAFATGKYRDKSA